MARSLAVLFVCGAILTAVVLVTSVPTVSSGMAEWPQMPYVAPVGLSQSPTDPQGVAPGIGQLAPVRDALSSLAEQQTAHRVLGGVVLGLFGIFALLLALGRGGTTTTMPRGADAYVLAVAGAAAAWTVLQPAHALLWLTEARMLTLLGSALALGYVALSANAEHERRDKPGIVGARLLMLVVALVVAPVAVVVAVPLALAWPRLVLRREPPEQRGTKARVWLRFELLAWVVAFGWLLAAFAFAGPPPHVVERLLGWPLDVAAALGGTTPLRVAEVEPALLGLGGAGLGALALLASVALLRARTRRVGAPLGLAGFAALALLLGAGAGAIDGRGVFVSGTWFVLPAALIAAALVRSLVHPLQPAAAAVVAPAPHTAASEARSANALSGAAGMLVGLSLIGGIAVTLMQHSDLRAHGPVPADWRQDHSSRTEVDLAILAPLTYGQLSATIEAARIARTRPVDYAGARRAWSRVTDQTEETVAAAEYLASLPESVPVPGVEVGRVMLLHGEAQVAELAWAHRLWQGRIGGMLPMVLEMPRDYELPEPSVYLVGASTEQESEPYNDLYARSLRRFGAAWQAAAAHGATDDEEMHARWVILFGGMLYRLADELTEEIVEEATRIGREQAGWTREETDEESGERTTYPWRLPALGIIPQKDEEPDIYVPVGTEFDDGEPEPVTWLLDRGILLKDLGERLAELATYPGQTADHAHLLWIGGKEEQALEMVTRDAQRAPDWDARLLIEARIRFNRFSGHDKRGETEEAEAAWREALTAVQRIRDLPVSRYPNRRLRLDALRQEALMWHFGPSHVENERALDLYTMLLRQNPSRALNDNERRAARERAETFALRYRPGTGEPDIPYLRGALYLEMQELEAAAEQFVEQLHRDPEHVLAQLDLGQMRYARAHAGYRDLMDEYSQTWRQRVPTLTREEAERYADFETLNPVPLWGLERAYIDDEAFMRRLEAVARRIDLAHHTDPRNPRIRELYHEFYYYRGEARLKLDEIDFAEMYMRQAYVSEANGAARIHGMPLADRLGRFYAEIWREMWTEVQMPESDAEPLSEEAQAVYDLLSRALKLSPEVRDQLYDFVTRVIGQNPDIEELDPNLRPFYVIAAELYPDWVPAQAWLGSWHDRQTRNPNLSVAERLNHWSKAEEHKLNALNELRREGREEFETMLLELAQFYGRWGAQQQELAQVEGLDNDEVLRRLQRAADLYTTAYERAREFHSFGRSRELVWQTIAVIQHERHRLAMMTGNRQAAAQFRDEAIDGYMMTVEPQSDDPNMAALRSLMQLRIRLLSAAGAEEDRLIELVNEYERWVPNPLETTLRVRDQILARRNQEAAIRALTEDNPQEALAALEEALKRDPGDGKLHLLYGQTAEALGDKQLALRHYGEALIARPPERIARYHLGLLYHELGHPGRALSQLEQFLFWVELLEDDEQGDPSPTVQVAANDARIVADEIRNRSWELLDEANEARAQGDHDRAITLLMRTFEINRGAHGITGGYESLLELLWGAERFRELFRWAGIGLHHDINVNNEVIYRYWRARASLALDVDEMPLRLDLGFWTTERTTTISLGDWQLRRIIQRWPNTEQAEQSRNLLRIRQQLRGD